MQKEMKEGGACSSTGGAGLVSLPALLQAGKAPDFLYYKMIPLRRKGAWKAERGKISMMETFLSSHADTGNYVLHIYPLKIVL
ncbi:hypothetical protein [uncultured Dialister sp.]|uniref:hypothetical protein n=1 Tax=uncultured Dialister sp. TaxID=278064 RepID=UPI00266F6447|nr:hypothetical protein [uncultured Dialister sp.]